MSLGIVTRIQRFSLSDGPGIRSTIFLKGCPLRCRWCSNPETQQAQSELVFRKSRCVDGCTLCVPHCTFGALSRKMGGEIVLDRHACKLSFNCIDACPSGALLRYGRELSVNEVLEEVSRDEAFYQRSGGGITLSGGEPLYQTDFSYEILNECRRKGYHTVLDTSGHGDWEDLLRLITTCDLVFYDIKHMDPEKHRLFTGVDNRHILENARRATRYGVPFVVRFPLIPGINNDERNLRAIADFVTELQTVERIDLLPFHRLGQPKHEELGRHWPMGEEQMPSAEDIEYAKNILITSGVPVVI